VVTKVIRAAAVALIVELTDLVLDKVGVSEDRRILRKVVKASVSAASGVLLGKVLHEAGEASEAGGSGPASTAAGA
jgi:hypothetical protein